MLNFLKDLFTGKDNSTFDVGRVLWCMSVLALLAFEGYAVMWHAQVFDPAQFAIGAGAILAAGGGALALKKDTEANEPDKPHHDGDH